MKKYILLILLAGFSGSIFSQSYYYTYTAGRTKFAVVIKLNKTPDSGFKKWEVTLFDVYNRSESFSDSTDDPLERYPFLAAVIIKIDRQKMNATLFRDPDREGILQDIYNKFKAEIATEKQVTPVATASAQQGGQAGGAASSAQKTNQTPVDSVPAKTSPPTPDTFSCHFNYKDSLFVLTITKDNDITELNLCKGKEAGEGTCTAGSIVEMTKENFGERLNAMLKKLTGSEAVENKDIKPEAGKIYDKYKDAEKSKKPKEISPEETQFSNRRAEIDSEKVTHSDLGMISLRDSTGKINIYSRDGSVFKEVKIDNVQFAIEDGKLLRKQLYVKIGQETYTNKSSPIPVNRINERGGDTLRKQNRPADGTYLMLGEVLKYEGNGYVPDDTTIILTPAKWTKTLSATSNLNSLINVALYTDLAGLLGRRANGIINTDVSGRFITNTRNIRNWDATPVSFVEGHVVLSKFDSKFKSIDSSAIKIGQNGQKDTIDRMQMIQTAWLKGSVKLNLLAYRFFYYQNFYVNIGARINVVNGDSLFGKERDIIFFDYYPELVYSVNRLKNFGMEISLKWLQQRVADKEPFENSGWESVFNPQISFFYNPVASQNSRIYLRFNYFANRKKDANNFYQLQFGIKTDLKLGSKK